MPGGIIIIMPGEAKDPVLVDGLSARQPDRGVRQGSTGADATPVFFVTSAVI